MWEVEGHLESLIGRQQPEIPHNPLTWGAGATREAFLRQGNVCSGLLSILSPYYLGTLHSIAGEVLALPPTRCVTWTRSSETTISFPPPKGQ